MPGKKLVRHARSPLTPRIFLVVRISSACSFGSTQPTLCFCLPFPLIHCPPTTSSANMGKIIYLLSSPTSLFCFLSVLPTWQRIFKDDRRRYSMPHSMARDLYHSVLPTVLFRGRMYWPAAIFFSSAADMPAIFLG